MNPDDGIHPRELISAYLDGELTRIEQAAVDEHLEDCADCGGLLVDLRTLAAETAAAGPPPLPVDLAGRIDQRVEAMARPFGGVGSRRPVWLLPMPMGAAATLLLVLATWVVWQSNRPSREAIKPARIAETSSPQETPSLRKPGPDDAARSAGENATAERARIMIAANKTIAVPDGKAGSSAAAGLLAEPESEPPAAPEAGRRDAAGTGLADGSDAGRADNDQFEQLAAAEPPATVVPDRQPPRAGIKKGAEAAASSEPAARATSSLAIVAGSTEVDALRDVESPDRSTRSAAGETRADAGSEAALPEPIELKRSKRELALPAPSSTELELALIEPSSTKPGAPPQAGFVAPPAEPPSAPAPSAAVASRGIEAGSPPGGAGSFPRTIELSTGRYRAVISEVGDLTINAPGYQCNVSAAVPQGVAGGGPIVPVPTEELKRIFTRTAERAVHGVPIEPLGASAEADLSGRAGSTGESRSTKSAASELPSFSTLSLNGADHSTLYRVIYFPGGAADNLNTAAGIAARIDRLIRENYRVSLEDRCGPLPSALRSY